MDPSVKITRLRDKTPSWYVHPRCHHFEAWMDLRGYSGTTTSSNCPMLMLGTAGRGLLTPKIPQAAPIPAANRVQGIGIRWQLFAREQIWATGSQNWVHPAPCPPSISTVSNVPTFLTHSTHFACLLHKGFCHQHIWESALLLISLVSKLPPVQSRWSIHQTLRPPLTEPQDGASIISSCVWPSSSLTKPKGAPNTGSTPEYETPTPTSSWDQWNPQWLKIPCKADRIEPE